MRNFLKKISIVILLRKMTTDIKNRHRRFLICENSRLKREFSLASRLKGLVAAIFKICDFKNYKNRND